MLGLTVPLLCIPGQAAYPCQPDLAANSEQCPFAHKGFWRMFPSRPQQMCGRRHRDNVLGFLTHVFPQGKQRPVRAPQREAPQKRGRTMGCDVFIMVECLPIILLKCLPIPLECSPIIPLECSPIHWNACPSCTRLLCPIPSSAYAGYAGMCLSSQHAGGSDVQGHQVTG